MDFIPADTSAPAARYQLTALRRKTTAQRLALTLELSHTVITLAKRALRRVHPLWSETELRRRFIELHYNKQLAARMTDLTNESKEPYMTATNEMAEALLPVAKLFQAIGVSYFIGGSVASSAHGLARSTLDIDMIANLQYPHVAQLVAALQDQYNIRAELIQQALATTSSFHIVHLQTGIKIDIFITKNRPYDSEAALRSRTDALSTDLEAPRFYIAPAEDIILAKLEWFQSGGGVSERQWHDIQGVLKVQGSAIDLKYLRKWALELGVLELLEKALVAADRE